MHLQVLIICIKTIKYIIYFINKLYIMVTFKRLNDRKIVLKNGAGPFPYKKNSAGKNVPKWQDYILDVFSRDDAKNKASDQTWGYVYYPAVISTAFYYTVNKDGYVPDGATIVYEKGADLYIDESILKKCTSGPLYGSSMVITCKNTNKFFSDDKINDARKEYAELEKARDDIKQLSLNIDEKINSGYEGRKDIAEKMKKLNKDLNDDLNEYNKNYYKLSKEKGNNVTFNAAIEDEELKNNSTHAYYYLWLSLAISGMVAVSVMARN